MFLYRLFQFVVTALVVLFLYGLFILTIQFIVGLDLFQGTKDALVFFSACFYFAIGSLLLVDFDKE